MMNDKDTQNEQLESILKRAHIPEPSPELKELVTAEAAKAWNQTSLELPWQIPVRRLTVSAAAAVLIIWLANYSSDYAMALWQTGGPQVAHKQSLDLNELPELSYSPLARHLVSASRKPSITEASALRSYAEKMLRILDEAQHNGASKSTAPIEGRSHLLPSQPGLYSYS